MVAPMTSLLTLAHRCVLVPLSVAALHAIARHPHTLTIDEAFAVASILGVQASAIFPTKQSGPANPPTPTLCAPSPTAPIIFC